MHFLDKETGTRCFYGPKYWVLRPEFHGPLKRTKARHGTIRRILLIFGGSDPGNLTVKALIQMLKLDQSYKTDILMSIDMWEHSFMDYVPAKDAKKKYITAVMRIINWSVINDRLNTKS